MKYLYSPQSTESICITVESSPVWEAILGVAGYTHTQLRHTFEMDEQWKKADKSISSALKKYLKEINKNNLWYGLIMLQNKVNAQSIPDFSHGVQSMETYTFYDTLLPYLSRETEQVRQQAARHPSQEQFDYFASYFHGHDYLESYVRSLGLYSKETLIDFFLAVSEEWHKFVSSHDKWEKWTQALAFEANQYSNMKSEDPLERIKRITGGIRYMPEPSIWNVKLIPHVSYRPWILELRNHDTKLFFYPLKDEYLLEPGVPSSELVQGHKALGDELRLKLLYQILKAPISLQELSNQFNSSKTTLHHQLSLLKAAKFISVEKGTYSANEKFISSFSEKLLNYLGLDK